MMANELMCCIREYVKITKDFALAAANAFQNIPAEEAEAGESAAAAADKIPFNFVYVYVSGNGVTLQPGRFTPIFGRVEGETRLALAKLRESNPSLWVASVRLSSTDTSTHNAIKGYIPKPGYARVGMGNGTWTGSQEWIQERMESYSAAG